MQIEVVLATRDALLKQREELETKTKQQTQDQSDIYQYLRKKLKDNYVAIAELETKVRRRARTNTRTFSKLSKSMFGGLRHRRKPPQCTYRVPKPVTFGAPMIYVICSTVLATTHNMGAHVVQRRVYTIDATKGRPMKLHSHRTQVSQAQDARLLREKQLLANIKDLDEERESEKVSVEPQLKEQ